MPATSCSAVVARVWEYVVHPAGHKPSEGKILQYKGLFKLTEYPTHDAHWLHCCWQFDCGFLVQYVGYPPLEWSQ